MIRLQFSVTIHPDPVCPVCCHGLVSDVWRVRHGIAFCILCYDSPLEAIRQARVNVRWVHRYHHQPSQWSVRNGISFYTGAHPIGNIRARLNEYAHHCDPSL